MFIAVAVAFLLGAGAGGFAVHKYYEKALAEAAALKASAEAAVQDIKKAI